MWICLNDGFYSVTEAPYLGDGMLAVRARNRSHLERLAPNLVIAESPDSDYQFRCGISREDFSKILVEKVGGIDYTNFKDSVTETPLKKSYLSVWQVMLGYAKSIGGTSNCAPFATTGHPIKGLKS